MNARDLFLEYHAAIARAQSPAARAWRDRAGWPRLAAAQGIGGGVARIAFSDSNYEPMPDERPGVGTPAVLIPCWDGPAPGQPADLVDLLAWVPTSGQVLTRCGNAAILGEEAVRRAEPCMGVTEPLHVFPNPTAWASAHAWDHRGDHGIVIIDWQRARSSLGHLVGAVDFIVHDIRTARRLRDVLRPRHEPVPHILIPTGVAA